VGSVSGASIGCGTRRRSTLYKNPASDHLPDVRFGKLGGFVRPADRCPRECAGVGAGSANVPGALRDIATSPVNPDEIAVATEQGVFRSADAGKSWTSLNDGLPNLPVARLLDLPEAGQGVRVELVGNRAAEWPPGEKQVWLAADNSDVVTEAQLRGALGALAGTRITAVALSGIPFMRERPTGSCAHLRIEGRRGKPTRRRARVRWNASG